MKRVPVADALGGVERIIGKLSDIRVELLRCSFAFWLGQILVFAALLRVLI